MAQERGRGGGGGAGSVTFLPEAQSVGAGVRKPVFVVTAFSHFVALRTGTRAGLYITPTDFPFLLTYPSYTLNNDSFSSLPFEPVHSWAFNLQCPLLACPVTPLPMATLV